MDGNNKFLSPFDLFWSKEGGFSTVGIVLALLISICLLFTGARVYEINSSVSNVQEVADASALAAENVVAEFYIVASLCDATILSLSLTLLVTLGLGVACLCTPYTSAIGEAFLKASEKIKDSRDRFSETAQSSLDKYQSILPFLAVAKAQSVFQANSSLPRKGNFNGVALLVPWEGKDKGSLSYEQSDKAQDEIEKKSDELKEEGSKAEEKAKEAKECKERAYLHDSGSQSNYCMYERASTLAGLSGADNPYFSSVETWSFSAALERAKSYYNKRASQEKPNGNSVAEQSNSALRKNFFQYASQEIQKGYVHEFEDSFDAYFPLLPKNTDEMRETTLYTESIYPIGQSSDKQTMHAWSGCPGLKEQTYVGQGSIQQMDGGSFEVCEKCEFKPSSMGSVASASSNIDNGFEYHYRIVAEQAKQYQKAREAFAPSAKKVKSITDDLFGFLKDAFDQACKQRIEVYPPGRFGVVCFAVNTGTSSSFSRLASLFIDDSRELEASVALSSAVLVKEPSDEKKNVINSFFDGVTQENAPALGPLRTIFDLWSSLLSSYTQGQNALLDGLRGALNSIPFASESKLGDWASGKLEAMIEKIGLEPADLSAPKPVLINSEHVLSADDSTFSAKLLSLKRFSISSPLASGDVFGTVLDGVEERGSEIIDQYSQEFEIARIELFDGAVSIPVTVILPSSFTDHARSLFASGIESLRGLAVSITGTRQWK
jgi:hypothetical protein